MTVFPGIIYGDKNAHGELKATLDAGKPITGHYSIPDLEIGLPAYAAAGIASCHESTTKEDALARGGHFVDAQVGEGLLVGLAHRPVEPVGVRAPDVADGQAPR